MHCLRIEIRSFFGIGKYSLVIGRLVVWGAQTMTLPKYGLDLKYFSSDEDLKKKLFDLAFVFANRIVWILESSTQIHNHAFVFQIQISNSVYENIFVLSLTYELNFEHGSFYFLSNHFKT